MSDPHNIFVNGMTSKILNEHFRRITLPGSGSWIFFILKKRFFHIEATPNLNCMGVSFSCQTVVIDYKLTFSKC